MIVDNTFNVLTNKWFEINDFIETNENGEIYFYNTHFLKKYIKENDYINKNETLELIENEKNKITFFFFKHKLNKYIVY